VVLGSSQFVATAQAASKNEVVKIDSKIISLIAL